MSNENFVCEDCHSQITIYFVDLFLYLKFVFGSQNLRRISIFNILF